MKKVAVIHLNSREGEETVRFLGQDVHLVYRGCGGDPGKARAFIEEFDGKADAIALQGMPSVLQLGPAQAPHEEGAKLLEVAKQTPAVDGSGIRTGLERWGVILADRAEPGIFAHKRVLMVPGLNHNGLIQALERRASVVQFADPFIYFGWLRMPGVGSGATLNRVARAQIDLLKNAPFRRIYPQAGEPKRERSPMPFKQADVLVGDIGPILRYAPDNLSKKTVVVGHANEEEIEELRKRGACIVVTMMPSLREDDPLGRWPASVIEAVLVALRPDPNLRCSEDTYLDMLADVHWSPCVRHLQPEEAGINRFAFVIHPLSLRFIRNHPLFWITRYLPDRLVEAAAAYMPPMYVSKIKGGVSPTTGQRIEGHLLSLGATPRMMMKHSDHFTYKKLNKCALMAEKRGARIMGLGAFTSVVGDAGITVAHEADIAITSGNSLTVAATLEAAKMAVRWMGKDDLSTGKVMIVGATGSIASVCSRLIAQAIKNVVLVSIEPEKLIDLKRTIQQETPGAQVTIATKTGDLVADCDLIISATSAFGQRVIDLTQCKPGAVICDVARPMDINPAEAALRPDVLVIESGEVIIPGEDLDFGYNIGLPPKTAYACLGETALLAMDGRFEDFTLGRQISMERVKEIWRLFKKHEFQIAGLRNYDGYVTEEMVAAKRALAEELRNDPERLARVKAEASEKLQRIPVMAKGVRTSVGRRKTRFSLDAGISAMAMMGGLWRRKRKRA
jgi:predicted amino acid dehydrogenase